MSSGYNIKWRRGDTLIRTFQWEESTFAHRAITNVAKTAPALITVPLHDVPNGWRVAITDVQGMYQINGKNNPPQTPDFKQATFVDANNISLNNVSSQSYSDYVSGGVVWYHPPKDLTGYTAEMTFKDSIGGTVLLTLTSPADILIDLAEYTISPVISAAVSLALPWDSAVYNLDMISPDATPVVTTIAWGTATVTEE